MTQRSPGITIRPATALDAVNIVKLLKLLWSEETALPAERVGDIGALRYVTDTLERGHVLVADQSGRISGTVACQAFDEPYSEDSLIEVRWLYVIKPLRLALLEELISAVEAYSDERGLPLVARVFSLTGNRVDHFGRRPGYVPMGPSYLRAPVENVLTSSLESQPDSPVDPPPG